MTTDVPIVRRLLPGRVGQLIRFYQAALINTLFGFSTYALLIRWGTNLYAAQAIAQVLGVGFNYMTYSRHVFRDRTASHRRFVLVYLTNYFINLALLVMYDRLFTSDYVAGLAATLTASLINYVALRTLVFRLPRTAA